MSVENQELRKAGLKVTLPRVKILQILENAEPREQHMSAEDVYRALLDAGERLIGFLEARNLDAGEDVGLATVYRVLTQFETAGLVTRHNFETGHSVFELAKGEHHDHMVCMESGEVIEFVDPVIERRQHELAEEHGYELVDHSLVLYVRKHSKSGGRK